MLECREARDDLWKTHKNFVPYRFFLIIQFLPFLGYFFCVHGSFKGDGRGCTGHSATHTVPAELESALSHL